MRHHIRFARGISYLLLVTAGVLCGCSKSPVKLYPVRGQVLFKDQPADGAQIVFQPVGDAVAGAPSVYGTAGADGSFDLRTEPYGAGAPAGDYNVFVTWYVPNPKNPEKGMSKLPAKYADQSNPVLKATVKEGDNALEPFRLK